MSERQNRCRVFNDRDQPVELHLGSNLVIVPPRGQVEVELDQAVWNSPQLQTLRAQGFITVHAFESLGPEVAEQTKDESQAPVQPLADTPSTEKTRGKAKQR